MVIHIALEAKESVVGASKAYLPREHWHLIKQDDEGRCSIDSTDTILEMYGGSQELFREILKFRMFPGSHKLFGGGLTELLLTEESVSANANKQSFIYKQDWFSLMLDVVVTANSYATTDVAPVISYYLQVKEKDLKGICEMVPFKTEKLAELKQRFVKDLTTTALKSIQLGKNEKTVSALLTKFKKILPKNDDDPEYAVVRKLIKRHAQIKPMKKHYTYYENWINRVAVSIQILEGFIADNPEMFRPKTEGPAIVRVLADREKLVMTHELLSEMRKAGLDCESIEAEIEESPALSTWDFDTVVARLGDQFKNIEFVFTQVKRTRHRAIYIPTIDGGYCIPAEDAVNEFFHYMISVKCVFQDLGEIRDAKRVWDFCEDIVAVFMGDYHGTRFINVKDIAELQADLEVNFREVIQDILDRRKMAVYKISNKGFSGEDVVIEMERFGYVTTCGAIRRYAERTVERLKLEFQTNTLRTWHMYVALERCLTICFFGRYPKVENFFHINKACASFQIECRQCIEEKIAREEEAKEEEAKENAPPPAPVEITGKEPTEED